MGHDGAKWPVSYCSCLSDPNPSAEGDTNLLIVEGTTEAPAQVVCVLVLLEGLQERSVAGNQLSDLRSFAPLHSVQRALLHLRLGTLVQFFFFN